MNLRGVFEISEEFEESEKFEEERIDGKKVRSLSIRDREMAREGWRGRDGEGWGRRGGR